jgi:hypothetical protein
LAGTSSQLSLPNSAATREPGEPVIGPGHSVWWKWRAPANGGLRFVRSGFSTGPNPPLTLGVFTGTELTNLIPVAIHPFSNYPEPDFIVPVQATTNYVLALDGMAGSRGPQSLQADFRSVASNDRFAQRAPLSVFPSFLTTSTLGASAEAGEPDHGGEPARHSLWWTWTTPSARLVTVTVDGSGQSLPILSVYQGTSLPKLTLVAENGFGSARAPKLTFQAAANVSYKFALDEPANSFSASLSLNAAAPPANDNFASRTPLKTLLPTIDGSLVAATAEPGEPDHTEGGARYSVWYEWMSRSAGPISIVASATRRSFEFNFHGSAPLPDPFVAVYTGSSLTNLQLTARGLGGVEFNTERGVLYEIAIDASNGLCTDFELIFSSPSGNDQFENASPIPDAPTVLNTTLLALRAAATESGQPDQAGTVSGHSLWWTWTARQTAAYVLHNVAPLYPFFLSSNPTLLPLVRTIYTGTNLSELTLVARTSAPEDLIFDVLAGRRYYLALDLADSRVDFGNFGATTGIQFSLIRQPVLSVKNVPSADAIDCTVEGGSGLSVVLQQSDDLITWSPIRSFQLSETDAHLRRPRSQLRSFYRLVPDW